MSQPCVKFERPRARRKRPVRRRFDPEVLESRHLPSVALPGITATDPVDGATPLKAPPSFTITFDQSVVDQVGALFADLFAVEPDQVLPTIVAGDNNRDVEIDRIGSDGVATPYVGGTDASPVIETVTTVTAADGTLQTQLVVSLPDGSPAFGPGTYWIDLVPTTNLAAVFAAVADPDSAWATATAPIPIAQFTVLGQGPTLGDATGLGSIGQNVQSISGSLDPGNYRSAVALYQFTLPQSGSWQLHATVLAQAIGSPLMPALTLFDASGNVLATRNAGAGTAADPIDPDMVIGLGGGTYFLGVSGAGNLPGSAHGYDPISGRPGTDDLRDPAGRFVLDLSATPVVPPTKLVDSKLDYADSLEPSPSELDLTFSGPVDLSPLKRPDGLQSTLTVIDAQGRAWPIAALDYQAAQHRLSLLFTEPLPAGDYSLVSPSPGGLTDLAGRPVVGPTGNPPGVLANWTVAAPAGPRDPHDLGILWPGPANVSWDSSISRATTIGGGQQVDYRFVVICPGVYALQMQTGDESIAVRIASSEGATIVDAGSLTQLSVSYVNLDPGVYDLRMIAEGSGPTTVQWTLKPLAIHNENILDNGVGQSTAISLALVGPSPGGSGTSSGPGGIGGTTSSAPFTSAATAGSAAAGPTSTGAATTDLASSSPATAAAAASPSAFGASAIPAALLVTLESGPVGQPSPDAGHTAVVGPLADGATIALADADRGLPPRIRYRSSSPSGQEPRIGEGDPEAPPPGPLAQVGPARPVGAADRESASARADVIALALAQTDPLVQITGWLAGGIVGRASEPREADLPAADLGTMLLASTAADDDFNAPRDPATAGPARGRPRAILTHADLGAPCALLVATALTYRLSEPVRKWWRRYHIAHAPWPRPYGLARGAAPSPGGS